MNDVLILAGQLLGMAFACGLNLYATIALLGLAGRFDLVAELPIGLGGLENWLVIGTAALLYVIEVIVDRIPFLDHAWEAAHTLARPVAAGLLVVLALLTQPWYVQAGAAAAAVIVALAAHGTKAGLRIIFSARWVDEAGNVRPHRGFARAAVSFLEDVLAVAIVVAALLYPTIAIFVLGAVLLLLLLGGPRLWRAAMLGIRAVVARARGFFGNPGWRSRDQLPRAIRAAVPAEALGTRPPRALRAAAYGLPGAGAYRHGFLVFAQGAPRFVYRARFRCRTAALLDIADVSLHRGLLTDTLEVSAATTFNGAGNSAAARKLTFFLLKDGPPPHLALAELQSGMP